MDYYLDMAKYMVGQDLLIYGFQPQTAHGASLCDGTVYYFDQDKVHFKANSGYEATHGIWDYGADYVTAEGWWYSYT